MKPETSQPHETSLAVWDVPSRAAMSRPFRVKIGAKCSAGCQLTGREIEVYDESGSKVANERLSETPWRGTSALYWAEVDLAAPPAEGIHSWAVKFAAAESHREASSSFSFPTVKPPEHTVTLKVVDRDTKSPVTDAALRLGVYRASTDQSGLAKMETAKGIYDLTVHKVNYEALPRTVDVSGDIDLQVEVWFAPKSTQDPYWG